ncbi:MAG: hypothetical protein GXO76_12015 [Calditrichaeota bacterium]|nr:hypothetical protein [Calditrichota bacterium]
MINRLLIVQRITECCPGPLFLAASLLLASLIFSGCRPTQNLQDTPPSFPYIFKTVREIEGYGIFMDLNHDGRDEYLSFGRDLALNHSQFILQNNDFEIIDQINFTGIIQFVTHFDWTGDGIDEIVTAYTRNDSSFLRFVDSKGNILKEAFLFSGKTRVSKSGTYRWYGQITAIRFADIDNDGRKEILVFPNEGFARSPRGVFVYDGQTLQLKWKYEVGPAISNNPIILNKNKLGEKNILFATSAPSNGNSANGTDDYHSIVFLLNPQGKLLWEKIYGGKFTRVESHFVDINGNGTRQVLLVIFNKYSAHSKPRIEIINPANGHPISRRNFPYANPFAWSFSVCQLDRKPDKEFVISNQTGHMVILNSHFEKIKEKQLDLSFSSIFTSEDLDGDGLDEIFVQSNNFYYWLGSDLDVRAKTALSLLPGLIFIHSPQVYHRHDQTPLLALFQRNGANAKLIRLVRNPHYLASAYGRPLLFASIGFLFLGLLVWTLKINQKRRFDEKLIEKEIGFRKNPVFVLDHKGRISQANFRAQQLFAFNGDALPLSPEKLSKTWQPLKQFLSELPGEEPIRQETTFSLREADHRFRAAAEPVFYPGKSRPYWLIFLFDLSVENRLESAKAWAAMAQRIAHDIKNPLTSILLTQQRLEMEYKRQDPKRAKLYEPYTRRIINRIESLRRMTRQFMKFVDVEKVMLQPTDINTFIREFLSSGMIEWPRDIQLIQKPGVNLPAILVDQEQLQILLENLISNAINAMPQGGTITLSTSLAPNLQFTSHNQPARDYIAIEILDTGKGISPNLREKLFRPFTTGTHLGTGLGLTIVKKIVDDHQGHIEIESEEGVGTSIIVYLPVAQMKH